MTLSAINYYLCASVLLGFAFLLLKTTKAFSARLLHPVAFKHQLSFCYAIILAALLLPGIGAFPDRINSLPQAAQVWTASTMRDVRDEVDGHRIAVSIAPMSATASLDTVSRIAASVFLFGFASLLFFVARDVIATIRIIANAQTVRKHGRLHVLASDRIQVPFSFWRPLSYFIVVPSTLIPHASDLRLAIRHEAQHHRQWDTKVLYLCQLLKAAFFWNPAAYAIERHVRELQEFACDESVSNHRSISVPNYCRCLLRVAEAATQSTSTVARIGMTGSDNGGILQQRIAALLAPPSRHLGRTTVIGAGCVAISLLATTALAFTSVIHDRRISFDDANAMAANARQGSVFPIVVNDRVVAELNSFLGTPDGRAFLQDSLARMKTHQALITERIQKHDLPLELLAVPLVESGYRNLPKTQNQKYGAGLWMFIESTAKRFGLTVDKQTDQRLDVEAETEAAMRLLASLHLQFNDWGLALLAYNAGGARVEKAIRETSSRDVWEITGKGYENDKDYLPKVMAAVLIIKNPSALN